jgi:uroporphyrinogen-III synthase
VLEIRPLDADLARAVVAQLDQFDIVIFVSDHAVALGMQLIAERWPARPRGLTWIAVGAATAAALARHGVTAVVPEEESSEGILGLAETRHVAGRRVLIVAGRGGRTELAAALTQRGGRVERLELYAREAVAAHDVALPDDGIAAVVVSSADGGRAFAALWRSVRGNFAIPVIVPSARVAKVLRDLAFTAVVESAGAGAAAVTDAVRDIVGASKHE